MIIQCRMFFTGFAVNIVAVFYSRIDMFRGYSDQHGVRPSVDASLCAS